MLKKILKKKHICFILTCLILVFIFQLPLFAQKRANVQFRVDLDSLTGPIQFSTSIQLLLTLTAISFIPFFLMTVTSFLRVVIVLGMVRTAIGTQQTPPSPVIIALSLFLTIFIMSPVWKEIDRVAIRPLNQGRINQQQAFDRGIEPLRQFMFKQTREKDLGLFIEFAQIKNIKSRKDIPTYVLIPAFSISELKTAFQIAFLLFLPFVVIDLVVSNILLSLGMFMLSPVIVSLPFKILLFVLADGWYLICKGLMESFFK
jgi:flagellar biosynthetic protein FliP